MALRRFQAFSSLQTVDSLKHWRLRCQPHGAYFVGVRRSDQYHSRKFTSRPNGDSNTTSRKAKASNSCHLSTSAYVCHRKSTSATLSQSCDPSAVDAEYSQCFRSVKQHRVSLAIAGDSRKQAISESWLGSRWSQELLQQSAPSGSQKVVENRVLPIRSLHVLIVISFLIILSRQAGLAFAARY